jgi:chemosensory pili system protein ChpA (sensor histidine kinase/response regulator)
VVAFQKSLPSVLVVDDTRDVREAVSLFLQSHGYDVESAVDGLDAVGKLEAGLRPDVILLDVAMPRMDGFAFRRWQAADARFASIPIVLLSGVYDPPRARRLSGLPVVSKTAGAEEIVAAIRQQLQEKQRGERAEEP